MLHIGRKHEAQRQRAQESDHGKDHGFAGLQEQGEQQERHQRTEHDLRLAGKGNAKILKDVSRQEAEHFEDGINGDGNQRDHDRPNHVVSAHARHRNSLPADRIMESAKPNIAVGWA